MLKLTRNERETGVEREAERERKEDNKVWGRKWWSMWSLQNKWEWHCNGCNLGNVELLYHHGTNSTVQRVHGSCRTMQPVLYVHTIRLWRADSTKTNHQIHHGEITNNKTTINKNNKTTMLKLTKNERETGVEQEAERERKEDNKAWGREWWSMWSSQNKRLWHCNGCDLGNVKLLYQHGTHGTVQRVHRSCCIMQPVLYVHTIR